MYWSQLGKMEDFCNAPEGHTLCAITTSFSWFLKHFWWKAFLRHRSYASLYCVYLYIFFPLRISLLTPWRQKLSLFTLYLPTPQGCTLGLTDLGCSSCGTHEHVQCEDRPWRVSPPCRHLVILNRTTLSLSHYCSSERSKNTLFKIQEGISEKHRWPCGNINSRQKNGDCVLKEKYEVILPSSLISGNNTYRKVTCF